MSSVIFSFGMVTQYEFFSFLFYSLLLFTNKFGGVEIKFK